MNDTTRVANLVGGFWQESPELETIDIVNPADLREIVGAVPRMDAAAIEAVYDAASRGAAAWRTTSPVERGRVLLRAAALLRERCSAIAQLLAREMGKTIGEATVEVTKSADFFEYYGGFGRASR